MRADTRAVISMGGAVFLWSWLPLGVALAGVALGPFAFLVWNTLAEMSVWFAYLMVFHRDLVFRRGMWGFAVRQLRTCDGVFSLAPSFWIVFFVWSAFFIDTVLVTVLTASVPMLFVVFRQRHDKRRSARRYKSVALREWVLLCVALFSISLVTLSQSGGLSIGGSWWRIPTGLLLSACAAVCSSCMAYRFGLGEELYSSKGRDGQSKNMGDKAELACLLVVMVVTSAIGLPVGYVADLTFGQGTVFSADVLVVVVLGGLGGLGGILFRYANLETSNLGINALWYVRPVLSLIWLAWFATVDVYRPDWLIVGTVGVIVANALISRRCDTT